MIFWRVFLPLTAPAVRRGDLVFMLTLGFYISRPYWAAGGSR